MDASPFILEAANVCPPGTGGSIAVTSASSTAGSGDFSAYAGKWLWLTASAKTHVRAGTSSVGAATTGDIYMTADTPYFWRVPKDGTLSYVRARTATGSGTIHYRVTSGAW